WLAPGDGRGDVGAAGLEAPDHPLLGAAVRLAGEDGGWVFTGRLSHAAQPWLADHAVLDTVLLPGTAFVELALATGEATDTPAVEELTLEAPLVLDDQAVQLQVTVAERDASGRRQVEI